MNKHVIMHSLIDKYKTIQLNLSFVRLKLNNESQVTLTIHFGNCTIYMYLICNTNIVQLYTIAPKYLGIIHEFNKLIQ